MATKLDISREKLIAELQKYYNGYSWTGNEKVFNPFSVLRALYYQKLKNYWFESGTPTFLIKLMQQEQALPQDFENLKMTELGLDTADIRNITLESLLFQTGYLTVTGLKKSELSELNNFFLLNFPNTEVRESFFTYLLTAYSGSKLSKTQPDLSDIREYLNEGKIKSATNILESYLAHIPGKLRIPAERYYQSLLYMALSLAGMKTELERWTATGVLDGVLELPQRIYFIEFKYAKTGKAETQALNAVNQIKTKNYAQAWRPLQGEKKLIALGVGVAGKKSAFLSEEI